MNVIGVLSCLRCGGVLEAVSVGQIIAGREGSVIMRCRDCTFEHQYMVRLLPVMQNVDPTKYGRLAPAACGTDSGYFRHRRLEQDPCTLCKTAHAAAERMRLGRKNR